MDGGKGLKSRYAYAYNHLWYILLTRTLTLHTHIEALTKGA